MFLHDATQLYYLIIIHYFSNHKALKLGKFICPFKACVFIGKKARMQESKAQECENMRARTQECEGENTTMQGRECENTM